MAAAFQLIPLFSVKGKYNGVEWGSQFSFLALEKEGEYWVQTSPRAQRGHDRIRPVRPAIPDR